MSNKEKRFVVLGRMVIDRDFDVEIAVCRSLEIAEAIAASLNAVHVSQKINENISESMNFLMPKDAKPESPTSEVVDRMEDLGYSL